MHCHTNRYRIEKQREMQARTPGISFAEVAKTVGDQWKQLSEIEKQPYKDMAAKDTQRVQNGVCRMRQHPVCDLCGLRRRGISSPQPTYKTCCLPFAVVSLICVCVCVVFSGYLVVQARR